jgi:kynureninase
VAAIGADFYAGGCLKWLCGGPGAAFLYVRPQTARRERPALTGWAAHRRPFRFELEMVFAGGSRGFQSGTPAVPSLYTARAGLEALRRVGPAQVRAKSLRLTELIIARAGERGFPVHSPGEKSRRAGHVAFHVPHGLAVKLALEARGVKTDFRRGGPGEPGVLRVGPHFYNTAEEVEALFREIDDVLRRKEYRAFFNARATVT